jgi:hypothetical protein
MNKVKGWKTIGFNVLTLVGVLVGLEMDPETVKANVDAIAVVVALGNALLRAVTNTGIFQRENSK